MRKKALSEPEREFARGEEGAAWCGRACERRWRGRQDVRGLREEKRKRKGKGVTELTARARAAGEGSRWEEVCVERDGVRQEQLFFAGGQKELGEGRARPGDAGD